MKLLRIFAAASAILSLACSGADSASTARAATKAAVGEPVAVVEGKPIYEQDLGIRGELLQLEQQVYQVKMQGLGERIANLLIEKEAEKRGVDAEELLDAEVLSKVSEPTSIEVEAFYEQQKSRIRRPLEDVREQVVEVLKNVREREAREQFVAGLREGADIQVMLDPPRVEIDLSQAPMLGPASAPVTIVEYSDFQCPFCKRVQPTLTALQDKYGDKVRWSFKDLPLVSIHPLAFQAAEAARCAGDQGKFWEYRAALFDAGRITEGIHEETAAGLGLNAEEFNGCLETGKHGDAVKADMAEAESLGMTGTPAFVINGVLLSGAQPLEAFTAVIDRELAKSAD